MKIQELKEKVLGAIEEAGKFSVLSVVTEIFYEYEQSNKSEESQIKENKQVLTNDFLLKLIEGMKKEIEALKKQVEAIDKFKVIDSDLKQEKYTLRCYQDKDEYSFQIFEDHILYSSHSKKDTAIKICKALNSMEASK